MPAETARPAGPNPVDFAGESPARIARRLLHATRPKFFPASVLPVLAGTAWGTAAAGAFDAVLFALALVATVCVHAGANVLNDVGDDAGGTDRQNTERIYPYTGGSRFIQAGIMGSAGMARLGISLLAVAAIAGLFLLLLRGPLILAFGIAGVLIAVLYSLGPVRLASLGVGELAVATGFGILPVTGAAWLQSGVIDWPVVLFAVPVSMWVAAILLINEVPDIAADAATGKRTLPVRCGLNGTAGIYLGLNVTALLATIALTLGGGLPAAAPLVPFALMFLAGRAASAIRRGVADRSGMTAAIESTLAIHTAGTLWLIGCLLFTMLRSG